MSLKMRASTSAGRTSTFLHRNACAQIHSIFLSMNSCCFPCYHYCQHL